MPPELHGRCDPDFAPVRDAFAAGFDERGELGAAVAVWSGGRLVVDLWAGAADAGAGARWQEDTIAHAYSVSKPLASACLWLLLERGLVELDAPVTRYWPEYGAAGKETTLVRHVLAHQSGLLTLRERQPAEALLDWNRLDALLAAEPPLFEPGTRCGEQALFHGHLVGELVRRVDGRRLGRFFADEIAGPWGLDFRFGLGEAEARRCALLVDPGGAWRRSLDDDPRRLLVAALDNPPGALDPAVVNSAAYRSAEVPAVNGHGSARAVATFYGGLASGGTLGGVRLFEQATVDEALRPVAAGEDVVLESPASWALGLQSEGPFFGLGGIGGFGGYGIRGDGVAAGFGYVTCKLDTHDRADACGDALEAVLGL
jgi:CubicO group peptidase (beta-lactamase class C family)